jgi:hypothetical protein
MPAGLGFLMVRTQEHEGHDLGSIPGRRDLSTLKVFHLQVEPCRSGKAATL